jgi:signal peptidase II
MGLEVSNLLDRVAFGSVVDFINVGLGTVRTVIFNVVDMAIMLGAAIVVLAGLQESTTSPPAQYREVAKRSVQQT